MKSLAALAATSVAMAGCSSALVQRWTPNAYGVDSECTETYTAPLADSLIGGTFVLASGGAVAAMQDDRHAVLTDFTIVSLIVLPAVLYVSSAIRGVRYVNECRHENASARRPPSQLNAAYQGPPGYAPTIGVAP